MLAAAACGRATQDERPPPVPPSPAAATTGSRASATPATSSAAEPTLVSFPTHDGGVLHADAYGAGGHGVVLAHGGRFRRGSWAAQAPVLADAGFRVLDIDYRGEGDSHAGPGPKAEGDDIHNDVLDAVRWLRANGATTVSVVGGSLGGWAAAQASVEARPGEIDRLVLLAHSPIEHPERMTGRKLFLVARDDPGPSGTPRLVRIREQYERAPDPKELVVLDGAAHAQFLFETDQAERLMQEILRFLSAP